MAELQGIAGAVMDGYAKWERKPHDLYPTPEETTQAIINALGLPKDVKVFDPGCGDGKLLRVWTANGYFKTFGSDIRKTGYGTGGVDFLRTEFIGEQPDVICMNPPFSLATEFIEKALAMAPIVAVLLKADFWNAQDRIALGNRYRPTHEYPLTWRPKFLESERGKNPLMNCTWFVWRRDAKGFFWRQLVRPTEYPVLEYRGTLVAMADLEAALEDLLAVF
jgi:hypothetical protein